MPPAGKKYVLVDDRVSALVCSSDRMGSGAYGEIRACNLDKVVKQGESFDREFEFMERTRADKNSSWVKMYRVASLEKRAFAMDAVHTTLHQVRVPQTEVASYAHRLIRALKDFHKKTHYTHNDVKPDNIGVMRDGAIKLIDLGSVVHQDSRFVDVPQTVLYTPLMDDDMNRHEVRVKSDYWAMGCTLYETVVVANRESLRCSMDRHLFFRGDMANFRIDMSFGLMMRIGLRDLRYILGLDESFDGERIAPEYLKRKRALFGKHPLGKKIYALMCPCFDPEKFDANTPRCPTQEETHLPAHPPRSASPKVADGCILAPKDKPFLMSQHIDRDMIKRMRAFLKSVPVNHKWGQEVLVSGGGSSNTSREDPSKLKVNHATLRELKRLILQHERKSS